VTVVGGGDSALEEATFIARFASKVYLVHRREEFRGSPIMVDRARQHEKIELVLNKAIDEVLGDTKVTGVRLRDTVTGELSELDTDGFFVAIGHDPNTSLFLEQLDHEADSGYLVTKGKTTQTNLPGVFAAGDVQDHTYRQAVTAAGSGCAAALDAERYLADRAHEKQSAAAAAA
jgi:thioredoxin reductase (NADPH)